MHAGGYRILHAARGDHVPLRVDVGASTRDASRDADADVAWHREKMRLGDRLFDGAMCRYEGHDAGPPFTLRVSRTGYRAFVVTNLFGRRDLPEACLCRPVGVSATLLCGDGVLLFGRRGDGVAYYPHRVHPFAGSLEWPDAGSPVDPFAECRRELREELLLDDDDLDDLKFAGVVEDLDLRHPELVFRAVTRLTSHEVASRLQPEEHAGVHRVAADVEALRRALADLRLTPVARAAVALHHAAV